MMFRERKSRAARALSFVLSASRIAATAPLLCPTTTHPGPARSGPLGSTMNGSHALSLHTCGSGMFVVRAS
jgi:hypothetical protein